MKIWLDPGHGADKRGRGDPGACAQGVSEEAIVSSTEANLGLVERLGHHLRARGYDVGLTRGPDEFVALAKRGPMAVKAKADLFIAVHVNAGGGEGLEVWVHPRAKHQELALAVRMLNRCLKRPEMSGMRDRGVKTAKWRVLSDTVDYMPTVLFEVGFIDNRDDRERLASRRFREAWALAMADAIDQWFAAP